MRRAVIAATAVLLFTLPTTANAAFPGQNGKLVFSTNGCDLFTINPDGSDLQEIGVCAAEPVWSPDGTKIAYAGSGDIHVINADGSGDTNVTAGLGEGGEHSPSWSPDGTRIAYERFTIEFDRDPVNQLHVWTSNVDGTNHVQLAPTMCRTYDPLWHPDGTRIAFDGNPTPYNGGCGPEPDQAWLINPDGTGQVPLPADGIHSWSPDGAKVAFSTPATCAHGECQIHIQPADGSAPATPIGPAGGLKPHWSPDGAKLVFEHVAGFGELHRLWTMNADGTGASQVTTYGVTESDWQPLPVNAYPRPKGASPTDVSLVPAYEPCAAPNRTHGPPLAFPSCGPPAQKPGQLTVGTPDANAQPAKSNAYLRINPLRGDPQTPADEADVRLRANINDVRLRSDLSDYTGSLEVRLSIQITDKDNTPHPGGPGPATVQEFTHSHPLPCAATADTTVGSTCQFDTTLEALVPGAVKELQRAIWQLGAIRVHDGAGNLFLTQGIFVP